MRLHRLERRSAALVPGGHVIGSLVIPETSCRGRRRQEGWSPPEVCHHRLLQALIPASLVARTVFVGCARNLSRRQ
jgi:hypothetical protein